MPSGEIAGGRIRYELAGNGSHAVLTLGGRLAALYPRLSETILQFLGPGERRA